MVKNMHENFNENWMKEGRKKQRKTLTCSSASKSALYWAMSSGGLFWTRLRHSSQMAKPATNMPMSGIKTRMPFPASAPITLRTKTNKKNRLTEGRHLFLEHKYEYKHPITIEREIGLVSWDRRVMENRIEGKKCINFARAHLIR